MESNKTLFNTVTYTAMYAIRSFLLEIEYPKLPYN